MDNTVAEQEAALTDSFVRGALTWHLYLLIGFFQLIVNLQGNILPSLKVEFDVSYRTIGLHPSACACGVCLVGIFGPRIIGAFGAIAC